MARATWKGVLRLSLVSCPVYLTPATMRAKPIRLHRVWAPRSPTTAQEAELDEADEQDERIAVRRGAQITPPTASPQGSARTVAPEQEPEAIAVSRVSMRAHDPNTGEELDRTEVAHGYEVERGRYVTLTKEESKALAPQRSTVLDLATFVPATEIDPLYFDTAYWLHPDGSAAVEPYRVITAAMDRREMVGITSIVLMRREHMAAVAARDGGLMLTTLRAADEVREAELYLPADELDPEMIDIAEAILRRRAGRFDPATVKDKYQDALRELIEAKSEGLPARPAAQTVAQTGVASLMAALKQSLAAERGAAPKSKRKAPDDRRQRSLLLPVSGTGRRSKAGDRQITRRRSKA
jgi:DNA end-binding protein Ku